MVALTLEERQEIKRLADRRQRLAAARKKAFGFDGDIDLTNEAWVSPSLAFSITQFEFECPNCARGDVECHIATSRSHMVRKTWRCRICRFVLVGQYKIYVMEEEP